MPVNVLAGIFDAKVSTPNRTQPIPLIDPKQFASPLRCPTNDLGHIRNRGYNFGMVWPHYVTKYLLKHFVGDENLFELVKATCSIQPRKLRFAGAEVGIWPDEIETGPMQQWDNPAHRVLQASVHRPGLTRIDLSSEDRKILNQWFFFYMIRSPAHRQTCRKLHDRGLIKYTHSQHKGQNYRDLFINRGQYLADAEASNPVAYAERVKKYGRIPLENALIDYWQTNILMDEVKGSKDGVGLYHQMLTSGNYRRYLKHVRDMKWTWLRSHYNFIIGDNPYDRCDSRTAGFNCGIATGYLEIFFPLGRHLCLWMHRRMRRAGELWIDEAQTMELNRRQIKNAVAKVWGPSVEVLSPIGVVSRSSPIP